MMLVVLIMVDQMRIPNIVVPIVLVCLAILFMPIVAVSYIPLPFTSGIIPTFSMYPNIIPGDVLYVDRTVDFSKVAVGDVILFWGTEGHPISHRVIVHDGVEVITRGDFNDSNDPPVTAEMYLGKVSAVIPLHVLGPQFGSIVGFFLTFSGIMFVSAVLYVLVHIKWLRSQFDGVRHIKTT